MVLVVIVEVVVLVVEVDVVVVVDVEVVGVVIPPQVERSGLAGPVKVPQVRGVCLIK